MLATRVTSSRMTASWAEVVSDRAVAITVSDPPSSVLRAAARNRLAP